MAQTDRRAGPWGRVYGPWREELARRRVTGREYDVFLALCEHLRFDGHGNAWAFYHRVTLARELGTSEAALRKATQGLKQKGALSVKTPGHNGFATEYNVMPGIPWPREKGGTVSTPLHGRPVSEGGTDSSHKGRRILTTHKKKG